jgi:dopamine beta-monooxygenase
MTIQTLSKVSTYCSIYLQIRTIGIVDSSGMRIYMTDQLRPIETGRFVMSGADDSRTSLIPSQMEQFTNYVYCPAECTKNLEDHPITIFTGLLHTHLIGNCLYRVNNK